MEPHMNAREHFLFDCPGQAELFTAHQSFCGMTLPCPVVLKKHQNLASICNNVLPAMVY
jgi:hypothetical protein